jgi:sugar O-acyltransferase (sialic acid O-acetyltransferase NeuD family)
MKRLAIIGSGDLAKQIAHHAVNDNHYEIAGCFNDFFEVGDTHNDFKILGTINSIQHCFNNGLFDELMIGIGYKHMALRNELFERFGSFIPFGTIVHSTSFVDKSAVIGKGSIIYPGCTIDMHANIGENCLVYNGCNVAHDSKIENHSILSPGVNIAGFCTIGKMVVLGIGTIVSDNVKIKDGLRTGAGTLVTKDLFEDGIYIGIPAKKMNS